MTSRSAPGASGRLRIACWNIWGFSWEWPRRRPLVAAELAGLKPDAVFLHETRSASRPWENGESTPAQVAADSGLIVVDWIDAPTTHPGSRMGPALLAGEPHIETSRHQLADRRSVANLGFHEPWLLTARWDLNGARLVVASTHLPMQGLRNAQNASVDRLAEVLPALSDDADLLILIGDLNLAPLSSRLYALTQAVGLKSVPSLRDAPPTWPTSNTMYNRQILDAGLSGLLHPEAPPIRIDHLLVRAGAHSPLKIVAEGRFGTTHRDGALYASDHWGLWFDVAAA